MGEPKGEKKNVVWLILLGALIISLVGTNPTVTGTPTSEKFDVTFEIESHLTYEILYITVQNLQDSQDFLTMKTILSDTDFSIYDVSNVEFAVEWMEEYQENVPDYDNVLYENIPIYDNDNNLIGYENGWRWEVVGSHLESREHLVWKSKALVNKTEDGLKGELKNQWEEIPIQKAGQSKDTLHFRFMFNYPLVARMTGWGSRGIISLDLNGETFVDLTASSWWDANWGYKKEITIDKDKVENENFDNFPVLIYWATDADLATHAMDNGDDIAFTNADGNVQLDHELENFDGSDGQLIAWVRIPTLYDNVDTTIFCYYGRAGSPPQQNPTGVWDDNFKMVQHMTDNTTSTIEDSTSNNNDGTKKAVDEPTEVDGKIAKAQDFDGTDDYVGCGTGITFGTDNFTIAGWFRWDAVNIDHGLFRRYLDFGNYYTMLYQDADDALYFYGKIGAPTTAYYYSGATGMSATTWYYIVWLRSGTTLKVYINGVEKSLTEAVAVGTNNIDAGLTTDFEIGIEKGVQASLNYMRGIIDEVRVSNVERSANWILTTFNNQNDPSTFFSVGAEESANVAPNKPTNLLPSVRQTTVNVTISCVVTDNDNDKENVAFYDNSDNSIIGWDNDVDNGATASVTWGVLTRGNTYTFFAGAQDNNGNWGENSDTQTFTVNSLPIAENQETDNRVNPDNLANLTPILSWDYHDNDGDTQENFQIQVGTTENANDMWDNNQQNSDNFITYDGSALDNDVTYHWRVRVHDNYEWSIWLYGGTFRLSGPPPPPPPEPERWEMPDPVLLVMLTLVLMVLGMAFDSPILAFFGGVSSIFVGLLLLDTLWVGMIFLGFGIYFILIAVMSEEGED